MAGYFTYQYFGSKKEIKFLENSVLGPVEWLGKHSFEIYMVHQPVIYGILELLFFLCGNPQFEGV